MDTRTVYKVTTRRDTSDTLRVVQVVIIYASAIPVDKDAHPEVYYYETVPPDFMTIPYAYTVEGGMLLYDPQ